MDSTGEILTHYGRLHHPGRRKQPPSRSQRSDQILDWEEEHNGLTWDGWGDGVTVGKDA